MRRSESQNHSHHTGEFTGRDAVQKQTLQDGNNGTSKKSVTHRYNNKKGRHQAGHPVGYSPKDSFKKKVKTTADVKGTKPSRNSLDFEVYMMFIIANSREMK